jgi:short-subunit dehydrogenase
MDKGVAVVSGAGRGIGAAVAVELAAAGHQVALVARSRGELDDIAARIDAAGGQAMACPVDLAETGAAEAVLAAVEDRLGPVAVVVNNAATVLPVDPLLASDGAAWWRAFEVNVRAPAELLRRALPGMIEQGRGVVVGVSSLLAALPLPGVSAYCASKAAFESLHMSVAHEVAGTGVRIVTFWPGTVDTVMQAEIRHEPTDVVGHRPAGAGMRTPADVAPYVAALCDSACTLSGVRIDMDDPDLLAHIRIPPRVGAT